MNICCAICRELFNQSDEMHVTQCGHMYHYACISQWFERSRTCPRCRKASNDSSLRRVYLDFSDTDGITTDVATLQSKLDSAEFNLRLKEKDVKKLTEEKSSIETLYKESESKLNSLKEKYKKTMVAVRGLTEHLDGLKKNVEDMTKLEKENKELTLKVQTYQNLEEIIKGSAGEVEMLLKNTQDVNQLCIYTIMLKKSIIESSTKKKKLQNDVRSLQTQINELEAENKELLSKTQLLESTSTYYERKYKNLELEMEKNRNDLLDESFVPKSVDKTETVSEIKSPEQDCINNSKIDIEIKEQTTSTLKKEDTATSSSSPYLSIKFNSNILLNNLHCKINPTSLKSSDSKSIYILKKFKSAGNANKTTATSLLNEMEQKRKEMETAYDGLGGHYKPDVFPSTARNLKIPLHFKKKRKMSFN